MGEVPGTVLLAGPAASALASGGAVLLGGLLLARGAGVRGLPGCGSGSACDAVTGGRWARLGPVPVAGVGAGVYAVMLVASVAVAWSPVYVGGRSLGEQVLVQAGLLAAAAAAWFVALQLLVVRRVCGYCMAAHGLACVAAAIVLSTAPAGVSVVRPAVVAVVAVAVFAAGQVAIVPRTYRVVPGDRVPTPEGGPAGAPATDPSRPEVSPDVPPASPRSARRVTLSRGRVTLDLGDWPVIGPPDAANVVAFLTDFTCGECHRLHRLLRQAVDRYAGRVAVAVVPVPMHPDCNPTTTCRRPEQAYACAFARLAWATWLAGPDRYERWDRFLAADDGPRPFGLALAEATAVADLGGANVRDPDAALDARIAAGVAVATAAAAPKTPAVLLAGGVLHGRVADLPTLLRLLEPYLTPATAAG